MTKTKWQDLSYQQKQAMYEHFEEVCKYPRYDEQWVEYGTGCQSQLVKNALLEKGLIEQHNKALNDEDWFILTEKGMRLIMNHYQKKAKKFLKEFSNK